MLIFTEKKILSSHLLPLITTNKAIGFVPTMGALHIGHLSLIEQSLKDSDITVVSIFVNPTQFNNKEDLDKYPRTLDLDVKQIESLNENVIVYAPSVGDIYDNSLASQNYNYDGLELQMEGKHRPGHFDGVGTIVKKLLEIVTPESAYFREKDFQQLQIVKKLVAKNEMPVTIIGCPIYREANGLAMSSRNERLSFESRKKAALIYKTLKEAKVFFQNHSANETQEFVVQTFEKNPSFDLEYFEIADEKNLLPCKKKNKNKKYRGFIAVFIDKVRLIDNIALY